MFVVLFTAVKSERYYRERRDFTAELRTSLLWCGFTDKARDVIFV
jgi:hypothetical protein